MELALLCMVFATNSTLHLALALIQHLETRKLAPAKALPCPFASNCKGDQGLCSRNNHTSAGGMRAPDIDRLTRASFLRKLELTPREAHVANLMLEGKPCQEIARDLNIRTQTVQAYARKACKKAGASSWRDFECLAEEEALRIAESKKG